MRHGKGGIPSVVHGYDADAEGCPDDLAVTSALLVHWNTSKSGVRPCRLHCPPPRSAVSRLWCICPSPTQRLRGRHVSRAWAAGGAGGARPAGFGLLVKNIHSSTTGEMQRGKIDVTESTPFWRQVSWDESIIAPFW